MPYTFFAVTLQPMVWYVMDTIARGKEIQWEKDRAREVREGRKA